MVFRIGTHATSPATLTFEGQLTEQAVAELRTLQQTTGAARVVLRTGTDVSRETLAALVALDLEITAESPFVSRWLAALRRAPRPDGSDDPAAARAAMLAAREKP